MFWEQLPEGSAAAEGDEVSMTVVLNQRTGARRAATAALLTRLEAHTEFGKVRRGPARTDGRAASHSQEGACDPPGGPQRDGIAMG